MPTRITTSITARTLLVSALLGVLLSASFVLLVTAINDQRDAGRLALRSQQAITAGTQLEKSVNSLETGLRGYVASGQELSLEPYNTSRRIYPAQLRRLRQLVKGRQDRGGAGQAHLRRDRRLHLVVGASRCWASRSTGPRPHARSSSTPTAAQRVAQIRSSFDALYARERTVAGERERRAEHRSTGSAVRWASAARSSRSG